MDYDADGTLDLISGSYDPGDIYLFRGLGDGKYAARETLTDEREIPLVHHPDELQRYQKAVADGEEGSIQDRVASFGSWPDLVDWDDDGDLDMVIGDFGGRLWLRTNKGTRAEPVYAAEPQPIAAGGKAFALPGHAAPIAADWNGDGRFDLVVGSSVGRVVWLENTGSAEAPEFAAARELVAAKSDNKFWVQQLGDDGVPQPGVRAQIDVVDYDGDGDLDLLLGDFCHYDKAPDGGDTDAAKERSSFKKPTSSFVWLYRRQSGAPAREASASGNDGR